MSDSPGNVANETWLEFIREASATKRAIEEATGRHRAVMKRAKSAGCNPAIIASAIAAKRKDPAIVLGEVKDSVRVFNLVGIAIEQTDLFGDWTPAVTEKAAEAHDRFTADERGYEAGKAGQDREGNPFTPGSPFHADWDAGWINGQAAIAERMGPDKKQVTARKARPERTAAAKSAPKAATKRPKKGKAGDTAATH